MRIAWLTPDDARSAIARYSREVVSALRPYAEVDIWSPGGPRASAPTADVSFSRDEGSVSALAAYDVVVHNLGDHHGYHRAIHWASRLHPGVVVLHDRSLNNLFYGLLGQVDDPSSTYLSRVEQLYGAEVRALAEQFVTGRLTRAWAESDALLGLSFDEDSLAGQRGALTHSELHAADVARRWAGPVCPLPFPTYSSLLEHRPEPHRPADDRVTLLTAGTLNRNKHIHDVIATLGEDQELARRVRYVVVGTCPPWDPYLRELGALISRYSLAATVKLLGYQPASEYARILDGADVYLNLRYPSLEGGSASAAEQLASGRPLIVYDSGGFAELPDDAVLKVPPRDRAALAGAIWALLDSPARRGALGAAGRREAEARSIERYAGRLLDFLSEVEDWPWRGLSDRVGAELVELGIGSDMVAHGRVGRALAALLPARSDAQVHEGGG